MKSPAFGSVFYNFGYSTEIEELYESSYFSCIKLVNFFLSYFIKSLVFFLSYLFANEPKILDRFRRIRAKLCFPKTGFNVIFQNELDLDLNEIVSDIFFVDYLKNGVVFKRNCI